MKWLSLYLMAALYVFAGINHFWHPRMYERIVPPYLPAPHILVIVSGICEIAFGLLLLPEGTRKPAAWLIIALLIAVLPANIQMMLDYYHRHHPYTWITIIRLPLQGVLIWWAWTFTR